MMEDCGVSEQNERNHAVFRMNQSSSLNALPTLWQSWLIFLCTIDLVLNMTRVVLTWDAVLRFSLES